MVSAMNMIRKLFLGVAVLAAALAVAPSASAHVRFGFFVGGPRVFVGPPVVYPPYFYEPYYDEGYYAPPVYAYPPPVGTPAGFTCYAGRYVCPLEVQHPVGGDCACPAYGGGRVDGTVR
jgi:hypothetical protein